MKNTILLSLYFFPLLLFAQERNELSSKINEVTVYQSGARVSRIAETAVEKGTQVFFLTGISSKMDTNSNISSMFVCWNAILQKKSPVRDI